MFLEDAAIREILDCLLRVPATESAQGRKSLVPTEAPSLNFDDSNRRTDLMGIVRQLLDVDVRLLLLFLENCEAAVSGTDLSSQLIRHCQVVRNASEGASTRQTTIPTRQERQLPHSAIVLERMSPWLWTHVLAGLGIIAPDAVLQPSRDASGYDGYDAFVIVESGMPERLLLCARAPRNPVTMDLVKTANLALSMDFDGGSVLVASLDELLPEVERASTTLRRKGLRLLGLSEVLGPLQPHAPSTRAFVQQVAHLPVRLDVILTAETWFHLFSDSLRTHWFHLMDSRGIAIEASHEIVSRVREQRKELEHAAYGPPATIEAGRTSESSEFDRSRYLHACQQEFQRVRYHALSLIPMRLDDRIHLEKMYVENEAEATETGESSAIVDQLIEDQLGPLAEQSTLRDHLRKQILSTMGAGVVASRDSLANHFRQKQFLAVVGDPGSGKSVSTKREILRYCGGPDHSTRVHTPVFVSLADAVRQLEGSHEHPEDLLLTAAAAQAQRQMLPLTSRDLIELESNGCLALFLDGFDEVADAKVRMTILKALTALVIRAERSGNRIVLTSRPGALRSIPLPHGMQIVHISPFSLSDIRNLSTFLLRWSTDGTGGDSTPLGLSEKKALDSLIRDCESKRSIMRLAQNPFLLTMLVGVYLEGAGRLVVRRHGIYQETIRILMHVRNRQSGQHVPSSTDVDLALSALASAALKRIGVSLESEFAVDVVDDALRGEDGSGYTRTELITLLTQADNAGLIAFRPSTSTNDGARTGFRHFSFLEYFAAIGLEAAGHEEIVQCARGLAWHNVAVLAAARTSERGRGTELLRTALKARPESHEPLTGRALELALELAEEMSDLPSGARRMLTDALTSALNAGSLRSSRSLREAVGARLGEIVAATGEPTLIKALTDATASTDSTMAAAAIELIACFPGEIEIRGSLQDAIVNAVSRPANTDATPADAHAPGDRSGRSARPPRVVTQAILRAIEDRAELRSTKVIDLLVAQLADTSSSRLYTALRAAEAVPSVYPVVAKELHRCLEHGNRGIAGLAGRTIVRGLAEAGRELDVDDSAIAHVLRRALERWGDIARPGNAQHVSLVVPLSQVRRLLQEGGERRLLGIRLLPWVTGGDEWMVETVRQHALTAATSIEEQLAGMAVLTMKDMPRRFFQERDFARIEAFAADPRDRRLRVAALRALSATRGGVSTAHMARTRIAAVERSGDIVEHRLVADVLCRAGRFEPATHAFVHEHAITALAAWSGREPQRSFTVTWVQACQDINVEAPAALCAKMLEYAKSYKVKSKDRATLFRAWARVSSLDERLISEICSLLRQERGLLFNDACAALGPVVERVRSNVQHLVQAPTLLLPLQEALLRAAPGIVRRARDDLDNECVEQARRAVRDIEEILSTNSDFAHARTPDP